MDRENRRLERKEETLKDPNDVFQCTIVLYSPTISKEKRDQVISVVLGKLANKIIENCRSEDFKAGLINPSGPS